MQSKESEREEDFFLHKHTLKSTATTTTQTMQRTRRANKSDAAVDARLGKRVNWLKEFMMMAAILVVCFLASFHTTPQALAGSHTHTDTLVPALVL